MLASRFERLLVEAVADERARRRWREHLHHRAPEPLAPESPPPLLFRGRSESGSRVEIVERADGTLDVMVDGACEERLESADELLATLPGLSFRLGGVAFAETFAASSKALESLVETIELGGPPPYRYARELLLDGLIDRDFGLTVRGRRALRLDRRSRAVAGWVLAAPIQVATRGRVGTRGQDAVEMKLAGLVRLTTRPVLFARATLIQEEDLARERPAIAKATVDVGGRIVRAHVAAPEMTEAVELLAERLRGRLDELSEREETERQEQGVSQPGRWRHGDLSAPRPDYFPRPTEERELLRRKTYALEPMSVEEAAWEMRMLDHDFHLFTNEATGEENVVFLGEDGVLHLKQTSRSEGAFVEPVVIDPAPAPVLSVREAIEALDVAGGAFLFFVERDRRRGAAVYRRFDGHYGLVSAAE